jgi:hypothetical protein
MKGFGIAKFVFHARDAGAAAHLFVDIHMFGLAFIAAECGDFLINGATLCQGSKVSTTSSCH